MELKEALELIESLKADGEKTQSALTKANGESADRRKTANDLKAKLAAFDGIDVDKYNESVKAAAKAEEDRLKQEGKFEEATATKLAPLKAEIETLKELIAGKDGKLSKVLIDNAVLSAIDGKAVNNEQVLALIRGNIKMDGDSPVVMNGDAPRVDDKGNHISVADYAVSFLADNAHLAKASGGGSGSQGNNGNNNQSGKSVTRTVFDGMTPVAQAAHCKDGGTISD